MAIDQGKEARVLACVVGGAETVADIKVDLNFTMTRHNIAAHMFNLMKDGKVQKIGEFTTEHQGRVAYRYGPTPRGRHVVEARS